MKKIFTLSLCLAIISISCKKSGSGGSTSSYYMKATIDGTAKTFNVDALGQKFTSGGVTFIGASGNVTTPTSSLEGMGITINNSPSQKPIVAGTYSETASPDFAAGAVYNPGSATIVYGTGLYPTTNPLKIIITAIDNSTIKGTFSGDFYYSNSSTQQIGPTKKTVTNGEFYVKFN